MDVLPMPGLLSGNADLADMFEIVPLQVPPGRGLLEVEELLDAELAGVAHAYGAELRSIARPAAPEPWA